MVPGGWEVSEGGFSDLPGPAQEYHLPAEVFFDMEYQVSFGQS